MHTLDMCFEHLHTLIFDTNSTKLGLATISNHLFMSTKSNKNEGKIIVHFSSVSCVLKNMYP
jgi:hypothetical protein